MFSIPKIYYNAETGNEGGGNDTTETDTTIVDNKDTQQAAPTEDKKEIPQQIISDEEMKSFGFNSKEELINFFAKQKEENISPEEKLEKENIAKANFLKFSAENKLLNVDDYSQYETLKSKSDADLVFEKHLAEFKTDHPEITDEKELAEDAKEDFDFEYKQKAGESEAAKKRGELKLAREAKELRTPFESKVLSAQSKFNETTSQEKLVKDNFPKFEKFLKESILKNTPDKLVAYKHKEGDTEIEIDIPLTQKERDAMFKEFSTPKTFQNFLDKKPEEIQAIVDKKMQGWIFQNKREEIISKGIEVGKGLGTKQGSDVGANNPFALAKNSPVQPTGDKTIEESNTQMSRSRQKYSTFR